MASGAVTAVTRSNSPICYTWRGDDSYQWQGSKADNKTWFAEFYIDNDFIETMGLKIIAGRSINLIKYPGDSNSIVINQSAVKVMGFKDPHRTGSQEEQAESCCRRCYQRFCV